MSADFWAGYISGAVGIIIGNPLDILKVRLQAGINRASQPATGTLSQSLPRTSSPASTSSSSTSILPSKTRQLLTSLATGTAAPILGYGALNALLFVAYNRCDSLLSTIPFLAHSLTTNDNPQKNLYTTWLAGALGGLATVIVSTPTELVKCRAQIANGRLSSWSITREMYRVGGIRGLFRGGGVTAWRDSVGYGFYFWAYEVGKRVLGEWGMGGEAAGTLMAGGVAGVVTWGSIFPLDVVKTRVQTRGVMVGAEAEAEAEVEGERRRLLGRRGEERYTARRAAVEAWREGGWRVFWRGLGVCSVRAFVVNAVQWVVYEGVMEELAVKKKN